MQDSITAVKEVFIEVLRVKSLLVSELEVIADQLTREVRSVEP